MGSQAELFDRSLFDPILCFGLGCCLPLHIQGFIRAATFERHDVIDHITGASAGCGSRGRARVLALKLLSSCKTTSDAASAVTLARNALDSTLCRRRVAAL
jgi:hypothetical protein